MQHDDLLFNLIFKTDTHYKYFVSSQVTLDLYLLNYIKNLYQTIFKNLSLMFRHFLFLVYFLGGTIASNHHNLFKGKDKMKGSD